MPVDRPTFSESWYRVSGLKPRLRATVQTYRQHFRGQMWHVIQDPSSNQFFRLNEAAYHFVALLDGRRTVAEAWDACNQELGDAAPTQGEAIQLLGQLYSSNLLQAELPPDAEGLLKRYQQRVSREVKGYLTNLLFIRIPLWDPDRFLETFLPAVAWLFSWIGFVLWLGLISVGLYFVVGRMGELVDRAANVLAPENLWLFYVAFVLVKVFHEFGHAFACKKFGKDAGTTGEVHTMGVMLLVFTPLPYVDASSMWAFRSKTRRVIVGMAGMIIELGIASIAAIIWANTSSGTTVHAITYNMMFIASVSTILFNANPLLRYDGYYILSDLLEIPNLQNRSRQYIYYLVRRYAWGVRKARDPAHTRGERVWFVLYGVASTVYRVVIVSAILLFVSSKLFVVGVALAIGAIFAWVMVPLGKFVKYLLTSNELMRVRARAIGSTVVVVALLIAFIGLVPMPDRSRIAGVVEPLEMSLIHPQADGTIVEFLEHGRIVQPGDVLVRLENDQLRTRLEATQAQREELLARKRLAQTEDLAAAQGIARAIEALDEQLATLRRDIEALVVRSPIAGRWIAPEIEFMQGRYIPAGEKIGMVASDEVRILAIAEQSISSQVYEEFREQQRTEIRVKDRPDLQTAGTIVQRVPAGQRRLPSRALGYQVGGTVQTAATDREGTRTKRPVFEVRIEPDNGGVIRSSPGAAPVPLLSGQRVLVRVASPEKPLAVQWWRSLMQLIQRRET